MFKGKIRLLLQPTIVHKNTKRAWGGVRGYGKRMYTLLNFVQKLCSPSRILWKVSVTLWIFNPGAINTFSYFRLWPLFSSLSRKCTDPRRSCNGFSWPTFCVGWPWCHTTCSAQTTWPPSSTAARPRPSEEAWRTSGSMKESGWGRSVFYFTVQQVRMLKWNRLVELSPFWIWKFWVGGWEYRKNFWSEKMMKTGLESHFLPNLKTCRLALKVTYKVMELIPLPWDYFCYCVVFSSISTLKSFFFLVWVK